MGKLSRVSNVFSSFSEATEVAANCIAKIISIIMAMGKPIVSTASVERMIEGGKEGLLARPGDADDLAAKIRMVLADRMLAEKMGKAARKRALAQYSWDAHTERLVEVIKECM